MAALPVPPFPLGQGSGAIVSIDLHVVIGEVTAPALGSLVPLVQVHKDDHFLLTENALGGVLVKGQAVPLPADRDGTRLGLEGDVHMLGAEGPPARRR